MLKPLGELTITASVIHQYGHSSEGLKLLEFCWNEFEQGNMLYNILQNHKGLINLGSYYNYFKKVNKKNEDLENIIQEIIEIRGIRYIDPHPWGLLELAMGFSSDPFRSPWQVKHLFKKTWLWALPDPWIINDTSIFFNPYGIFRYPFWNISIQYTE